MSNAYLTAFLTSLLVLLAACPRAAYSQPAAPAADPQWLIAPEQGDSFSFVVYHGGKQMISTMFRAWGPNWTPYIGFSSRASKVEGDAFVSSAPAKFGADSLSCAQRVTQSGERAVTWEYEVSAEKQFPLTMFATAWSVPGGVEGDLEVTAADGASKTMPFRMGKGGQDKVTKVTYRFKDAGTLTLSFDPAIDLAYDNALRIKLVGDTMPAGKRTARITATADAPVRFVYKPEDRDALNTTPAGPDWYPLEEVADLGPSVVGMESWLPTPAGARGGVRIVGDHFEFANGGVAKFWGTNLCYEGSSPPKEEADFTAKRFAKYGINCVRFHKFLERGIGDKNDGTKLNPDGLARMDYFTSVLASKGVYYTFSPFFGFHVGPGNKDQLLAYDEIAKLSNRGIGNTYGLANYAEDVQALIAQMYTNLLTHKNPHTGKTYAEDPALAAVEIQNEDDIFWGFMKAVYPKCPTYAKALEGRFADWLKAKYGSDEKLKAAWAGALKDGESLEARNFAIQYDPWFSGSTGLPQQTGGGRQRMLDNAAFLHHTQEKFYATVVDAIRKTGYKGPIIGSPWQATGGLPHYYNLKSDANVGLVDRHNYFSGVESSMLARPGSGYLGTGLQQVADRPFSVSEWIHVWPAMYAAEGPAILAVYGMGLQGWDASWEFQSGLRLRITRGGRNTTPLAMRDLSGGREGDGYDVWNVDTPANLGQFPALARMIYRGDVTPGEVLSVRQVSDETLATGNFDFEDKVVQTGPRGDEKTITSTVPREALAAGRVLVEFTGKNPAKSTMPDMARFEKDSVITSTTGQLAWDYSGKGFFTVNTPGTRAAVGFHTGKPLVYGDVTITPAAQFASIFLTALEPEKTLADCRGALLCALARQANSGFSYFINKQTVSNGKAPTLLEPVKATFSFAGRKVASVNVLNHEGRRVEGRTVPVEGDAFTIDTGRDKSFYYEVLFAE